jgi:hypothetical protein
MRNPSPRLDTSPDPALDAFLEELRRSTNTAEVLAGVYGVTLPALSRAYREHLAHTNPLVDQPTRRILRIALSDIDDAIAWGARALDVVASADDDARRSAADWTVHLNAYLSAAGGLAGDKPAARQLLPPRARLRSHWTFIRGATRRFQESYNFEFPPHDVYAMPNVPADERNLAPSASARSRWTSSR